MKKSLFIISAGLLVGCSALQPVPANRITIKTPQGSYHIETPKQVTIDKLDAEVNTNGTITLKADKWQSTNDPQVIDKATAGRVAEIKAMGDIAGTIAAQAVQAAAKSAVP